MKEIVHGTLTAYTQHKCKCLVCLENWNEYCREGRKRRNPDAPYTGRRPRKGEPQFCPICGVEKTLNNTLPYRGNLLFSYCTSCRNLKGKETYERTKEHHKSMTTKARIRRGGRNYNYQKHQAKNFLKESKKRDEVRGLENDLTLSFVEEGMNSPCSCCEATDMRMTLDRVDNSLGHLQSNVVPSCRRCNYLRRDMPYSAWIKFFPVLKEIHKENLFGDWTPGPKSHRIRK